MGIKVHCPSLLLRSLRTTWFSFLGTDFLTVERYCHSLVTPIFCYNITEYQSLRFCIRYNKHFQHGRLFYLTTFWLRKVFFHYVFNRCFYHIIPISETLYNSRKIVLFAIHIYHLLAILYLTNILAKTVFLL